MAFLLVFIFDILVSQLVAFWFLDLSDSSFLTIRALMSRSSIVLLCSVVLFWVFIFLFSFSRLAISSVIFFIVSSLSLAICLASVVCFFLLFYFF